MDNQRRNRNQWNRNDDAAPRKPEPRRDAGAYIGRMPERSTTPETGPGGMIRRDSRSGGFAPQGGPTRPESQPGARPDARPDADQAPAGVAAPPLTIDESQREAGENN